MDNATLSLHHTVQRVVEKLPTDVQQFVQSHCNFSAMESRDLSSTLGCGHKQYHMSLSCHATEDSIARAIAAKWLEHTHGFLTWSGHDKDRKETESRWLTRQWGFTLLRTETDIMLERLRESRTIADHRAVIQQVLSYPQENEKPENDVDQQQIYDKSRQWMREILTEYDELLRRYRCEPLPALPAYRENGARSGLDDNVQWCDDAIKVVRELPAQIDSNMIAQMISLLRDLRDLPSSQFPKIDEALFEKTRCRMQRVFEKCAARDRRFYRIPFEHYRDNPRLQWVASAFAQLARIARDGPLQSVEEQRSVRQISMTEVIRRSQEARRHLSFYAATERVYRVVDSQYANGLKNLHEEIIHVIDEWNELASSDACRVMDAFDGLTSGELKNLYDAMGRAHDIDQIVASVLFGAGVDQLYYRESRECVIDKVIARLTEIQAEGDRLRDNAAFSQDKVRLSDEDSLAGNGRRKEARKVQETPASRIWRWCVSLYETTIKAFFSAMWEHVDKS